MSEENPPTQPAKANETTSTDDKPDKPHDHDMRTLTNSSTTTAIITTTETPTTLAAKNTKVACLQCRTRKLKCDKLTPICTRCKTRNVECVYVDHKKTGPKPNSKRVKRNITTDTGSKVTKSKPKVTRKETSQLFEKVNHSMVNSKSTGDVTMINRENNASKQQRQQQQHEYDLNPPHNIPQLELLSYHPIESRSSKKKASSYLPLAQQQAILEAGIKELGLTMDDIAELHEHWFNAPHVVFEYSKARYMHYFKTAPLTVLHFSYMIWATSALEIPSLEHRAYSIYQKALQLADKYWVQFWNQPEFNTLYYLHSICERLYFEFVTGMDLKCALSMCTLVRLAQMAGFDQLDVSTKTLINPSVFIKSCIWHVSPEGDDDDDDEEEEDDNGSSADSDDNNDKTDNTVEKDKENEPRKDKENKKSYHGATNELSNQDEPDDGLDPEIPLIEEKRRMFWDIYALDKWYSLITGLPCSIVSDTTSAIFTKLPSPTTFVLLNGGEIAETQGSNGLDQQNPGYYLHEAMRKIEDFFKFG
ncbi:unnamed protein product [Ambrosiozyma monospora]|uniref:Unnamed protein product n=1 Tax=Ambrosiozyma monospora TaxID=43982 RepID=A0A9W6YW24_AMBMO|nr:unnamed protein product [Ambrosiozyma monospora]